jgi:2-dehydropantoate 2-reductase
MDVIIFTGKGQDTTQASEDMRAMVGPETEIISFQNGLSGVEILLEKFNPEKINPGITYVPAVLEKPGFIRHTGPVTRSVFGPYKPRSMELHNHIAESLQSVGMDVHALPEPLPEVWEKFVVLAPFHLVGCLTRLPLGGWISSPELQDLFLNAMKEVIAVGVKKGVAITPDIAEKQLHFCKNKSDPKTRASMLDDLNRGKRLEMDSTIGWLCREGKRLGVPTPIHETGYALLTPYREGTPEQP